MSTNEDIDTNSPFKNSEGMSTQRRLNRKVYVNEFSSQNETGT